MGTETALNDALTAIWEAGTNALLHSHAEKTEVWVEWQGLKPAVAIRDDGIGIRPEDLEDAFVRGLTSGLPTMLRLSQKLKVTSRHDGGSFNCYEFTSGNSTIELALAIQDSEEDVDPAAQGRWWATEVRIELLENVINEELIRAVEVWFTSHYTDSRVSPRVYGIDVKGNVVSYTPLGAPA